MPLLDKHGTELKVGDKVTLTCKVTADTTNGYADRNVYVETVEPLGGGSPVGVELNSRQLVKATHTDDEPKARGPRNVGLDDHTADNLGKMRGDVPPSAAEKAGQGTTGESITLETYRQLQAEDHRYEAAEKRQIAENAIEAADRYPRETAKEIDAAHVKAAEKGRAEDDEEATTKPKPGEGVAGKSAEPGTPPSNIGPPKSPQTPAKDSGRKK